MEQAGAVCVCTHVHVAVHRRARAHARHAHVACVAAAGLAACLGLIKDKGMLKDTVQWAGRTNDKKPVALIGLEDVYTGACWREAARECWCFVACRHILARAHACAAVARAPRTRILAREAKRTTTHRTHHMLSPRNATQAARTRTPWRSASRRPSRSATNLGA
jgi:hypothetical protein